MTSVAHAPTHGGAHEHAPMGFWQKYIFSTDHKIIGIQFLFVSLFFLLIGGILAMQIRWQLAFPGKPMPGGGILPETMTQGAVILPEYYIQLVTMQAPSASNEECADEPRKRNLVVARRCSNAYGAALVAVEELP